MGDNKPITASAQGKASTQEQQISELEEQLAHEKDVRREERFFFIVIVLLLFNIVFFTVMPSSGGPLALLVLELLILIPLARRMGMQEMARILNRVFDRIADKGADGE